MVFSASMNDYSKLFEKRRFGEEKSFTEECCLIKRFFAGKIIVKEHFQTIRKQVMTDGYVL